MDPFKLAPARCGVLIIRNNRESFFTVENSTSGKAHLGAIGDTVVPGDRGQQAIAVVRGYYHCDLSITM